MKKLTAILLIFAMLVPLSPAVAADEMSAKPTVEEILNEYHQKAFEQEMQGDTDTASTWSRRGGSTKTLEQETVDTLNNAGYEAYHVTADNYETLEAELHTDFGDLGLDPEGSYIVVISGEESEDPANQNGNPNSRVSPEIDLEGPPDVGGSGFQYIYEGTIYTMRYLTITASVSNASDMISQSEYIVEERFLLENVVLDVLNTTLIAIADKVAEEALDTAVPIATIASLCSDWMTDDNYTEIEPGTLRIDAYTYWTCELIQIWYEYTESWETAQCSEYTNSRTRGSRLVDDPTTGLPTWQDSDWISVRDYSSKYFDTNQRKEDAAREFERYSVALDYVYKVDFFFGNEDGEITWGSESKPLFTNERDFTIPLHSDE